jgi:hypothetical protein
LLQNRCIFDSQTLHNRFTIAAQVLRNYFAIIFKNYGIAINHHKISAFLYILLTSYIFANTQKAAKWLETRSAPFLLPSTTKSEEKERNEMPTVAAANWSIERDKKWDEENIQWWKEKWQSNTRRYAKANPKILYNYCVIRMSDHPNDNYFLYKGKLRYVSSKSLINLGYERFMVIHIDLRYDANNVAHIPRGEEISKKEMKKVLKKLRARGG